MISRRRTDAKAEVSGQGHQSPNIHIGLLVLAPAHAPPLRMTALTCGLWNGVLFSCCANPESVGKRCLPEPRLDRSEVMMRFRDDSLRGMRGMGGTGGMTSEAEAGVGTEDT